MNTNQWCKIITCGTDQVLITKDYDQEEDAPKITCTCDINGIRAAIGLGFDTEEKRDKAFDEYDEKVANGFLNDMNKLINQP